jgi:pyruvate kinase
MRAGVKIDLPVLSPQDIIDLQKFACKNRMDFIAASFVQVRGETTQWAWGGRGGDVGGRRRV